MDGHQSQKNTLDRKQARARKKKLTQLGVVPKLRDTGVGVSPDKPIGLTN